MIPAASRDGCRALGKPRASGDDPTVYKDGIKKTA